MKDAYESYVAESDDMSKAVEPTKRQRRRPRMARIVVSLSEELIDWVDMTAEQDFTTRSEIVRTALLWYLRPQGRDLDQTDPEQIEKLMRQRRGLAMINAMRHELDHME